MATDGIGQISGLSRLAARHLAGAIVKCRVLSRERLGGVLEKAGDEFLSFEEREE